MGKPKKERNLKQIGQNWFIDFTCDGKRIRLLGGFTKEQARLTLAKIRTEKLNEKLGFKKPVKPDIGFMEFAREFIDVYSKQNKRSWERDETALRCLEPHFKGKKMRDIGPEIIERYKAKRKTEVAPGTVNRELAFLKTLFNKAVEWGRLESSPTANIKRFKEPNHKDRILNTSEMTKLLDEANGYLKPIIIVALNTAMRKGEILNLKWENVDFSKRCIHVEDSKSGRSRNIPMNSLVIEALSVRPQTQIYVFPSPRTGKVFKNIKASFRIACNKAEIKGLRFHDLRHTSATRMIEVGVPLVVVSKILGHSSIQMTMRYAHPTPENIRLAVEKLGTFYEKTRQEVDIAKIKKPATVLLSDN